MQRKEFIKTCGLACIGTTAIGTILQSCSSTNYFAQSTYSNNQITINKKEFIVTDKEKSRQRAYVIIKNNNLYFPICLYKISEENYSAVLMECTHKSCELQPQGNFLVCPCHGSEFTNKGIVQNPPAEENLKSFNITTDNDNIYIQL